MAVRVLIVDDDAAFLESAVALLRGGGLEVVAAVTTGEQGLALGREIRPDVVLLDIRLPDVDGFTVCRALVDAGVPVVLCSTRAARDYGPRIGDSGANGFLPKERLSVAGLLDLLGNG